MKQFKGIVKGRYGIATYIKPEYLERFGSYIQEAGREAIQKVMEMGEDDITAVPEEKVEDLLENTVWKVIYTDRETHEKWVEFPKPFKKWLHYWVNQKLATIEAPKKKPSQNKENVLAFYLFGKVHELYEQGFLNGKVVLDSLLEVYEKQDELKPIRNAEYKKLKKTLEGVGKVYINLKYHPELRDWYVDLPPAKRKAVWVAVHQKILDKLANLCHDISNLKALKKV
jgi:hypothetical protein